MAEKPVDIIGIGAEGAAGLSQVLQEKIMAASELWGSERLLNLFPQAPGKRVPLQAGFLSAIEPLIHRLDEGPIVILASGDPGFYGIAASVLRVLPAEKVQIHPQVSSLQLAFARAGLTWQDAGFTSVHARPITEAIGLARRYPKVGILTDPKHTPAWVAEQFLMAGLPDCRTIICENLGQPDEKLTDTRLSALEGQEFGSLNVLLMVQDSSWIPAPIIRSRPDTAYQHKNGLITKRDVRSLSISHLQLRETDLVWDIGAGSGAVSIEIAETVWRGQVIAIEKDAECLSCINENIRRFNVTNLRVISGEAPEALANLPAPSAVFIGGSGGHLIEILETVAQSSRAGCRVAANFALLENLLLAADWMRNHQWASEIIEAQFSYGAATGGGTRLSPANPIFILTGIVRAAGAGEAANHEGNE